MAALLGKDVNVLKIVNYDKSLLSTLPDILTNLGLVQYEDQVYRILQSLDTGTNLYLYGKGGFGKTTVLVAVLNHLKIPFITVSFNSGLAAAFNNPTLPATESSAIEDVMVVRLDKLKGVTAPKVVIVSEIGDAPMNVLEASKDLMESGFYAGMPAGDGGAIGDFKCLFIGTGNMDFKDVLSDPTSPKFMSYTAASQRLPLRQNVEWKHYTIHALADYFRKNGIKNPKVVEQLAMTISAKANRGYNTPPRVLSFINECAKSSTGMSGTLDVNKFIKDLEGYKEVAELSERDFTDLREALNQAALIEQNKESLAQLDTKLATHLNSIKALPKATQVQILENLVIEFRTLRNNVVSNDALQAKFESMANNFLGLQLKFAQELKEDAKKTNLGVITYASSLFKSKK